MEKSCSNPCLERRSYGRRPPRVFSQTARCPRNAAQCKGVKQSQSLRSGKWSHWKPRLPFCRTENTIFFRKFQECTVEPLSELISRFQDLLSGLIYAVKHPAPKPWNWECSQKKNQRLPQHQHVTKPQQDACPNREGVATVAVGFSG